VLGETVTVFCFLVNKKTESCTKKKIWKDAENKKPAGRAG